jgi:preprotein translocase subunit SecB
MILEMRPVNFSGMMEKRKKQREKRCTENEVIMR